MNELKEAAKLLSNYYCSDNWIAVEVLLRAFPDRQRTQIVLYIMCELDAPKGLEFAEWYASNV